MRKFALGLAAGPGALLYGIVSRLTGQTGIDLVLAALPRTCPGLVVVQHMPEKFTAAFAQRLGAEVKSVEAPTLAQGLAEVTRLP